MSMEGDFTQWATAKGLDSKTIQLVIACAASPEAMKEAFDKMWPSPPIFPLGDIQKLQEEDSLGVSPEKSGFLIVGFCPSGDPIAIDIGAEMGSVWYMDHETMAADNLRSEAIRVADNLSHFMKRFVHEDDFPFDYYDAKEKVK